MQQQEKKEKHSLFRVGALITIAVPMSGCVSRDDHQ